MRKRTIEGQDVYRNARLKASKCNPVLKSMEKTCELLFISRRLLWEIEKGQVVPDSEIVSHMAKLYDAPELIYWHCAKECPLGASVHVQPIEGIPIERVVINLVYLMKQANGLIDNLIENVRDSQAGENSDRAIKQVIRWSNEIAHLSRELDVLLQKTERSGED